MKSSNFNCICLLSVILLIALAFPVYIESFSRRKWSKKFKSDTSDNSDNSDNSDTSDNSNRKINRFNRKIKRFNRKINNKINNPMSQIKQSTSNLSTSNLSTSNLSTSNLSTREERNQEREIQREDVNKAQDIVNNPNSSNFVKLKKLKFLLN